MKALLLALAALVAAPAAVPAPQPLPRTPQTETTVFEWDGSAPCGDGVFSFLVDRVDFQVGEIQIDIDMRGWWKFAGIGTIYGFAPPNGCQPGIDNHTRWRCYTSGLGFGVSIDQPYPQVGNCPAFTPSVVSANSDAYLWGQCHDLPQSFIIASELDPPTLYTATKKSMTPTVQTTSITDQAMLDLFYAKENPDPVEVFVAQSFSYGIDWLGCTHPYSPSRFHDVTVAVTLIEAQ